MQDVHKSPRKSPVSPPCRFQIREARRGVVEQASMTLPRSVAYTAGRCQGRACHAGPGAAAATATCIAKQVQNLQCQQSGILFQQEVCMYVLSTPPNKQRCPAHHLNAPFAAARARWGPWPTKWRRWSERRRRRRGTLPWCMPCPGWNVQQARRCCRRVLHGDVWSCTACLGVVQQAAPGTVKPRHATHGNTRCTCATDMHTSACTNH